MTLDPRIARIIDGVIGIEAGFTKDPLDGGNWTGGKPNVGTLEGTRWGIAVATARAAGYTGAMQDLPRQTAFDIYARKYVADPRFDAVIALNVDIGAELVDTGVNMGPPVAGCLLQRWLNGLNDGRYPALTVDGHLGDQSIAALRAYLAWRGAEGVKVLLRGLNGSQADRYLENTESRPTQRRYLYGWVLQRVEM